MKKGLTAETAETAEKKILWILGELCVLCDKTSHLFTRSERLHYVERSASCVWVYRGW